MPNFTYNGYEFYDVPKNGGTTVRLWLKHAEQGLPEDFNLDGYYTLAKIGLPRGWNDTVMGDEQFFSPGIESNRRWCIVRDPVDRFISAYTDKILREALAPWNVEDCLNMLGSGEMKQIAREGPNMQHKQAACHLLGQCHWLGYERCYFDHVFKITEMEQVRVFCQKHVFHIPLPAFHGRNQDKSGTTRVALSDAQTEKVKRINAADYAVGWC